MAIQLDVELRGVQEIRKQLKELANEYIAATKAADKERMAAIADEAGNLRKELEGVNKAFSGFAEGTNLEQAQNAFTGLKDSIMNLDFAGASKKAAVFNQTLKALKPEDFMSQIKGLGSTFMALGQTIGIVIKQVIALGVSLLANPIFLIAAVIVAIIVAVVGVLKYFGKLDIVIKAIMAPINDIIQAFKDLTDSIGLTSFAAEENAARTLAANEKLIESSKERQDAVGASYDFEIKMAKIAGKETLGMELEKSRTYQKFSKEKIKTAEAALKDQLKLGENGDKEVIKKLKTQIKEERALILEQVRDRKLIVAQNQADKQKELDKELEDEKRANDEKRKARIDAAKKAADDAKKFAENRLAAQRLIKDIEISMIKSDADREIVATQEKYARLIADTQKNENYTKDEKIKLKQLYQKQLEFELGKQEQVELDAEKEKQKKLLDEYNAGLIKKYELEDKQALQLQELQAKKADELVQLAKDKRAIQFDAEVAAAGENQELIKALTIKYQEDLNAIDKKAAEDAVKITQEAEKKKRDAQLETANNALKLAEDSTKSIQAVGDIAFAAKMAKVKKGSKEEEELAKKQFKFNKAMQLSGAIIDAGKAVTASLAAAPIATPIGVASLIATVATSAANIAKIASTQFTSTGGGGGNAPNIPTASSSSTTGSATPAFNLFGGGNNMNNVGADGQTQQTEITVKAVVSETEITNTQNKVTKINKNATL